MSKCERCGDTGFVGIMHLPCHECKRKNEYSPIVLVGPTGSGKPDVIGILGGTVEQQKSCAGCVCEYTDKRLGLPDKCLNCHGFSNYKPKEG